MTMIKIDIHPNAQRWYDYEPEFYIQAAREWVDEWEYEEDAHGYCHHRSILVGLLREIERLTGKNVNDEPGIKQAVQAEKAKAPK